MHLSNYEKNHTVDKGMTEEEHGRNCPACSPDPAQQGPCTAAHIKTCWQEEWDKISAETHHYLVSSIVEQLFSVVKKNSMSLLCKHVYLYTYMYRCMHWAYTDSL